jgi:hypothetical protein
VEQEFWLERFTRNTPVIVAVRNCHSSCFHEAGAIFECGCVAVSDLYFGNDDRERIASRDLDYCAWADQVMLDAVA